MDTIYEVPLLFHKPNHHLATICLDLLKLPHKKHKHIAAWQKMTKRALTVWPKKVRIAMVGKYFVTGEYSLVDSYVSVVEAIRHASWKLGLSVEFSWIDSETLVDKVEDVLNGFNGIIVPQGWGSRGTEGKIAAIKYARENKILYLGLCFGMQMATIEFARNILGMKKANTTEADPKTPYPVIHVMPDQKKYLEKNQYGGTIRLGAWPCMLKKNTKIWKAYKDYGSDKDSPWNISSGKNVYKLTDKSSKLIFERHRHRYEFNNLYKKKFEDAGFVISGTSPDGKLVEAIELIDHPFFVGTQFHPEYISRPLTPHPLFISFLEATLR